MMFPNIRNLKLHNQLINLLTPTPSCMYGSIEKLYINVYFEIQIEHGTGILGTAHLTVPTNVDKCIGEYICNTYFSLIRIRVFYSGQPSGDYQYSVSITEYDSVADCVTNFIPISIRICCYRLMLDINE